MRTGYEYNRVFDLCWVVSSELQILRRKHDLEGWIEIVRAVLRVKTRFEIDDIGNKKKK